MEIRKLTIENTVALARRATGVLKADGIILYPTDTLYGLGGNALSDIAVEKVYEIKGREERKPIHAVFADLDMAERCAHMNENARALAKAYLPGALTLILKKKKAVRSGIGRGGIETIGVRIPDNQFCLALAMEFGAPFTTTSANKSGEAPEHSVAEILEQLGDAASLIDLAIDGGALPAPLPLPSTVVDVSLSPPVIVREGAIPAADIWDVLREEV